MDSSLELDRAPLLPSTPRRAPIGPAARRTLLRDRRLWSFVLANALTMVGYSLWTNWTMLYLVDVHRLTLRKPRRYALDSTVFALLGGFAGGWLSLRLIERGCHSAGRAFRVCVIGAALSLAHRRDSRRARAAAGPRPESRSASSPSRRMSVNVYSLPLDVVRRARAPHSA